MSEMNTILYPFTNIQDIHNAGGPALLRELLQYMHSHHHQHLTLHELALYANMSDASVSRYIKKQTGRNFEDCLREIRLSYAIHELMATDRPITEIAINHGFSASSAFNKIFKAAYGTTPGIYRKAAGKASSIAHIQNTSSPTDLYAIDYLHATALTNAGDALPNTGDTLPNVDNALPNAGAGLRAANHLLPVTLLHAAVLPRTYHDSEIPPAMRLKAPEQAAINLGNASDLKQTRLQRQLATLTRELTFKYVRIGNIFSADMDFRSGHSYTMLNFDQLDDVFDTILESGCLPMIDLAEKPRIVKKNIYEALIYKKENFYLNDKEEYAILEAFFRHLTRRYGAERLQGWRFEYWYDRIQDDPDAGLMDYFARFSQVSALLKAAIPGTLLGGCGLPLVDFDMDAIIGRWAKEPQQPDFLTFEYYPYNGRDLARPLQWTTGWITSPEHLNQEIALIRASVQKHMGQQLPIYITEWNMSLSSRNYFNDTCAKAALFANYAISLSSDTDMLAYSAASDFASRAYDQARSFSGGNGLLTRDGIPKPIYHIFIFLNACGNILLARGNGCRITQTISPDAGSAEYEILCTHPGSFSWNFTQRSEDEITPEYVHAIFGKEGPRAFSFEIKNIESGTYLLTRYSINNEHNDVLSQWLSVNAIESPGEELSRYLRDITRPRLSAKTLQVDHGRLVIKESLALHETVLLKIRKTHATGPVCT